MEYFVKPKLKKESGSLLTTVNTYVAISSFRIRGYKSKTFVLKAVTNNLLFRIEFSMDDSTYYIRLDDISVTTAAAVMKEDTTNSEVRGHHGFCRISIKPAVDDVHGTGSFDFEGSSL